MLMSRLVDAARLIGLQPGLSRAASSYASSKAVASSAYRNGRATPVRAPNRCR